jgi:hypothetical protein
MSRLFHVVPYCQPEQPDGWDFDFYVTGRGSQDALMTEWNEARLGLAAFVNQIHCYPAEHHTAAVRDGALQFTLDLCKVVADLWAWRLRDRIATTQLSRWQEPLQVSTQSTGICFTPKPYDLEMNIAVDTFMIMVVPSLPEQVDRILTTDPAEALRFRGVHNGIKKVVNAMVAADERILDFETTNYRASGHEKDPLLFHKAIYTPLQVQVQANATSAAQDPELVAVIRTEGPPQYKSLLFHQRQSLVLLPQVAFCLPK